MRGFRERPKCMNACNYCRKRKVKCTGESRCSNCSDHGQECVYPRLPQRRPRNHDAEGSHIHDRLARVEAVLNVMPSRPSGFSESLRLSSHPEWTPNSDYKTSYTQQHTSKTELNERRDADVGRTEVETAHDHLATFDIPEERQGEKEECIIAPEKINWEYHGPISWLSICSEPGIIWVAERTGVSDFAKSARSLSLGWTRRLKLDSSMSRERATEVDSKIAWRFAKAYFEECYDTVFGLVHRPAFEARLRRHFEDNFPDDPAWYAIRHVVYASGCRILLSKDPSTSFVEAQQEAWKYFENALAMHTELLCTPSGLPAVQALTLMSYYVEGLGSPALEYTFCAGAVRLAQAKGLHRQAAKGWNLPESEVLNRNWLWWAIYCCDKHIAKRSGRPSAIDDDDISCQIPTKKDSGSSVDVEIFTYIIKHAQISGRICRRLGSVKALQSTPATLIETIADLERELQDWHISLPHHLKLQVGRNFAPVPSGTRFNHLMYLHNAYYGSLLAIHTIFSYPWISAFFGTPKSPDFRNQVLSSTDALAEAARNIILTTRHIGIDGASPHWLAFSYPIFALINLFICVLKNPTSPTSHSDLALMDMVAGHFAHMDFVTSSQMSFPFTRELATLARQTVVSAMEKHSANSKVALAPLSDVPLDMSDDALENLDEMNMTDLDMEGWNIFSSFGVDGAVPDWGYVFRS